VAANFGQFALYFLQDLVGHSWRQLAVAVGLRRFAALDNAAYKGLLCRTLALGYRVWGAVLASTGLPVAALVRHTSLQFEFSFD
jgi:hypothetical protein